ncbi:MAG TPA: hypothetical protein VKT70_05165, partial [Stellaceae bacterium]|nr:hypothetical protein [Stellaceae bacterium]
ESLRISDINETQIAELTSSTAIEASMKSSFAELVRLRRVAAQKAAAENVIKLQLQELTTDQARIRENVSRVGNNGDLYKRYIEKLNAQETQFETLQEASIKAAAETRDAKAAIDGFIAKLAS